jgi:hypothetical protein
MKKITAILAFILFLGFGFTQTTVAQPIATFPWTETFPTATFPPTADWRNVQTRVGGTSTWDRVTTNGISGTINASARHTQPGAGNSVSSWLITPAFAIPATGDFSLEFASRVSLANQPNRLLSIFYSVGEGTDTTTFLKLMDITGDAIASQIQWAPIKASLNEHLGKTIRLAFVYKGTGAVGEWQISDIYVGASRGQDVITELPFFEDFNSPSVVFPPIGWERARTATGTATNDNQWLRTTSAPASTPNPAARHQTAASNTFSSWLMTPAIAIPTVGDFEFDFLSGVTTVNADRYTAVFVIPGGSTDTTQAVLLHHLTGDDVGTANVYRQITRSLNAYRGQTIRVAFVLRASAGVGHWNIDDVRVQTARPSKITATVPSFTIVPAFRAIPNPTAIFSTESFAQTNVVLDVNFNGTSLGSSNPVSTMGINAAQMLSVTPTTPAMPLPGANTIVHKVTTEILKDGSELVNTHNFQATTTGEYAFDDPTATPVLVNINGDATAANRVMLGHIFTFTEITMLREIKFYMGEIGGLPQVYVAPINPLTYALSTAIQGVQNFNGTRVEGWNTHIFANPHLLQPGSYFVAVFNNGVAGQNLPLGRDGVAGQTFFQKLNSGLTPAPTAEISTAENGAPMIRVVIGAATPTQTGLVVTPARPQTTFRWDSVAPRYTINVASTGGTITRTHTTPAAHTNTWSVDLPADSTFTWEVIAHGGTNATAQGLEFTVPRDTARLTPTAIAQGDAINLFEEHNLGNITVTNRGSIALTGEINLSATLEVNGTVVGTENMTSVTTAWAINGTRQYTFPNLRANLSANGEHTVRIWINNTDILTGAFVASPDTIEKKIVNRVLRDSITPTVIPQTYTMVPITQSPLNFAARVVVPTNPPSLDSQTNVALNISFDGNVIATSTPVEVLRPGTTETLTAIPSMAPALGIGNNVFNLSITSDKITGENAITATQTVQGTINEYAADDPESTIFGFRNANATTAAGNVFTITETTSLTAVNVRFATGTTNNPRIQLVEVDGLTVERVILDNLVAFPSRTASAWNTHVLAEPIELEPGTYFLGISGSGNLDITHDGIGGKTFYTRNNANLTAVTTTGGTTAATGGMPRVRMVFASEERTVNITQTTGGTISVKNGENVVTNGETFDIGTTLTLKAEADEADGYEFVEWMDENNKPERTLRLMRDTTISATFALKTYEITFDANGGVGTMTAQTFTHGIAKALPEKEFTYAHKTFLGWATTATGTVEYVDEANYTATANATLYAVWKQITHTIALSASPSIGGTVDGEGTKNQGAEITVTATANDGYKFVNWTDGTTSVSTNAEYTFTVEGDRTLVANFALKTYLVTFDGNGATSGTMSPQTFTHGTSQALTTNAYTKTDKEFAGWDYDANAILGHYRDGFMYLATSDITLYAIWVDVLPDEYSVTLSANPTIGGNVTGYGSYFEGVEAEVIATPNANYIFVNWTANGTIISTNATFTFTVTQDTVLVANFALKTYEVTYSTPTGGTLTVTCPEGAVASGTNVDHGTVLTITAAPSANHTLTTLTVNGTTFTSGNTHTVTGAVTIVATFTENPKFVLTLNADPVAGGTIVSGAGSYFAGEQVAIEASVNANYNFTGWFETGGTTAIATTLVHNYTMPAAATTLTARFALKQYQVTYATPTGGTLTVTRPEGAVASGTNVDHGTVLTITAAASANHTLTTLTVNGTAFTSGNTHTVTGAVTIVATFTENPKFVLTLDADPVAGGTIVRGAGSYYAGEQVTIEASVNTNYNFTGWFESGGTTAISTNLVHTYTMPAAATTVTARFALKTYTVTITQTNGGTVAVTKVSAKSPVNSGEELEHGTELTLVATPAQGYEFVKWTHDDHNLPNHSHTLIEPVTISAEFKLIETSIKETIENKVLIYPNPVVDVLNIQTDEVVTQIVVLDLTGKVVLQLNGNHRTVNLQSIPTGNYIVRIHTETAIIPVRIVKQ